MSKVRLPGTKLLSVITCMSLLDDVIEVPCTGQWVRCQDECGVRNGECGIGIEKQQV